ncbi:Cytoplasmic dynein 2 heavy chain 1 [Chytridiales sp. JEL 0842]|nr:Cytoplasmic dynein 2 heavy chain 1 [Chytridiales sp. JEL 0842]
MSILQSAHQLIELHLGANDAYNDDGGRRENDIDDILKSFLLDSNSTALSLFVSRSKSNTLKVIRDADLDGLSLAEPTIILTKPKTGSVKDIAELCVTQIPYSAEKALYHAIHSVYTPLIRKSKLKVNDKIKSLLADLDRGLSNDLGPQGGDSFGINSIQDELQYWERRMSSKKDKDSDRCAMFKDSIAAIKSEFDYVSSKPIINIIELIEKVQDFLDDIWRQTEFSTYPQDRMVRLMELICQDLITMLRSKLLGINIMKDPIAKKTLSHYEKVSQNADSTASTKLRELLCCTQTQPYQMLQEFQKYAELICRERIHKRLSLERETILGQVLNSLRSTQAELEDRRHAEKDYDAYYVSSAIRNILWARQILDKINETRRAVLLLCPTDDSISNVSEDLSRALKKYESSQLDIWVQNTMQFISSEKSQGSGKINRLLELNSSDGSLRVNFDEALVVLIREVRQLTSIGLQIPAAILQRAEKAQKYYRYGIILKQVSHFYNTIHEQMLPSQFTMLLGRAKAFERLIKEPKASNSDRELSWDSPAEVDDYIGQLQLAASNLTADNRRLRKLHSNVTDTVIKLFDVDLVKPHTKHKWKEHLSVIRNSVSLAAEGGITHDQTLIWRNHWDYQLYKVLEYQYRVSLESLNECLPEIKVDLIFQQQKLQFRPAFENLRANYYRDLKNIINIPTSFKGLGDTGIFTKMVDRNATSLAIVYHKAEILFRNILAVFESFQEWVVLGSVPLEDFVEEAICDVADWELNFRLIKAKGKEAEQIPSTIRVDCFIISTTPVKAAIDDHLQRLFDCMLAALRKAINVHVAVIDEFVTKGTETLGKRPQTLEEITEANARHEELSGAKSSIIQHFEEAEIKNKLLRSVAGGGVDTSKIQAKWSKLELMLESHELVIREQFDMLKNAMEGRIQDFAKDFDKFVSRWKSLRPRFEEMSGDQHVSKAIAIIEDRKTELEELRILKEQLSKDCDHFKISQFDFPELADVEHEILSQESMWRLCESFTNEVQRFLSEDWLSFRGKVNSFEDMLLGWIDKMRSRPVDLLSTHIQREIDGYREVVPYLKFLRGDSWMSEHWGELFRVIQISKGTSLSELTFGHLLQVKDVILSKINDIKDLNNRANGEVTIREALQELDMWGAGALFTLVDYQDAAGNTIQIIKDWRDLLAQVGDNQSLLQSLKDSPYYKGFADKSQIWERKLAELDEVLTNLNTVQRKWVYLEPIFNRGALPSEQHRFTRVNEDFCRICQFISKDSRVVSIISMTNIRETLTALVDQLERCQKALNEFLEQKRSIFPRFYFIGDEDLLEILGQAKNPSVIQAHLKKLFAGVHEVSFDEQMSHIVAMKSLEGETVLLKNPIRISPEVEKWLDEFSSEMKHTLQSLLQECLKENDIINFPSQILTLSEYILFTEKCEAALNSNGLAKIAKEYKDKLDKLTSFDCSSVEDNTERHVLEMKIKSLVLDCIHFIDVIKQLQDSKAVSINDWAWLRQLRFYDEKNGRVSISMNDATFDYTFEYQGNPPKLVHTPLTDKCYLTLTQAISSGFGGNPFGPAGTGKTESVKALGSLFGRQVLVFNCDEGIDYKSMGRIFIGLIKCGAWGCFDEFNRLEEAVLSAVSQQIQVIQGALKVKQKTVRLLESDVELNMNSGIFVTLNPAGKGYGGRQRLPDNLKQLFRSVAMTHPNNELISEVILISEGFQHGKVLGSKVVSAFTLCKQLLSHQQHYDWGLRPLKTVLSFAGRLLHEEKKRGNLNGSREAAIVVKALRVNTLSKLTFSDSQRFNGLMKDIFPNVDPEEIQYEDLKDAICFTYEEMQLEYSETQCQKVFQLHEACRQRMGVVIVGPSGSGKSVLWQVLEKAWQKCGQKLRKYVVNPKAIDRQTLLGHMDSDTREWFDGILTYASRQAVKEPLDTHTWIICDGDIDPEWVESLNSVLDDNRLLTMPNGERIQFGPNVNFIFETHNLKFASPATVSRMGMIYLSDESLDAKNIVTSWILRQPEDDRKRLQDNIDSFFYKALDWVIHNGESVIETTRAGIIFNGLSHLAGKLDRLDFVYALIKGFGANLYDENRLKLANEVLQIANELSPDPKRALDFYSDRNKVKLYELSEPEILDGNQFTDIDQIPMVETVALKRAADIVMPWISDGQPFILVGPEGAGKDMLLRHCFKLSYSTSVATIHCSAQTRSSHLLQRLSQMCMGASTNTGRVLRPKDTEKLILYLKDINLPKPDGYDTVELIQFLQQLILYHGFYDSNLEWVGIENIQIVASMNPSNTLGRSNLSTRFTAIVRHCYLSYPEPEQLQTVYKLLLRPVISLALKSHQVWDMPRNVSKLAASMVNIYDQVTQKFTVDMHNHYIFTPRDLSRWIVSLTRYNYESDQEFELLDIVGYEAIRLFRDRLVGKEARKTFHDILSSTMKGDWNYTLELDQVIFSCCGTGTLSHQTPKLARESLSNYIELVQREIYTFERDSKDLNLCLFPEALENIARMERVLTQPGGSLLLIGRPGVGRRSSVQLVAHMFKMKVYTPNISRAYTRKHFSAFLKEVLQTAGGSSESCVMIIEDFQLVEANFIESINSLLSGSEVPGLYAGDELDSLLNSLKPSHSEEGYRGSLFDFFLSRVRKNLHIVIITDYTSKHFAYNCESNPALFTRCQVEWMDNWEQSSVEIVCSESLLANETLQSIPDEEGISRKMMQIHESYLKKGGAPGQLVEFIKTYEYVYCNKLQQLKDKVKYLNGGLQKLEEASSFVDNLSAEAQKQGVELSEKQRLADVALEQITDSIAKASDQKKEMELLTAKLKEEEENMIQSKAEIEKQLAEVEPIVRQAKSAVGEIRNESLTEIRSLRAPPPAIRDVLEGVLRLMGNLDMSWNSMKGFLGKRTIKDEIMNFDARNVTPSVRESVMSLLDSKKDSFDEATIKRVSVAAAPLAQWVKANIQYSEVLERIGPLELEMNRLTKTLDKSRERIANLKSSLETVDQNVAHLREDFGAKTRDAEALRSNLRKASEIIGNASKLLDKLSGEGKRWKMQVQDINNKMCDLPCNALLAAAFITYLTGSSEEVRQKFSIEWSKIVQLDNFNFRQVMSTESEQLLWKSQGLPSDTLSAENAIAILNSVPVPLIIDPSSQASIWLKTYLADRKPDVVKQHDDSFLKGLELAIRFGKTLIVEDVTKIEPIFYPLLRRDLIKQGPRYMVQLGDRMIDYNENFRLYLISPLSIFTTPPDTAGLINEVNFTITRAGLAGQLLGIILKHEKPELELEKVKLIQREDALKIQLSSLEESLLRELASADGNILENTTLIESLNETKEKSSSITASLKESHKLQIELDEEREKFTPLSVFGSNLYFVVQNLQAINSMYQYSLASFLRLFEQALKIEGSATNDGTELRIKLLIGVLEKLTFKSISRSIFKADRPTFALCLIRELHPQLFEQNEWALFTGQLVHADHDEGRRSECPKWVPESRQQQFMLIESALPSLYQQLCVNEVEEWSKWMKSSTCDESLPDFLARKISPFQKVLIVQALRPDRLLSAITAFCCSVIGLKDLSPPTLNFKKIHSQTLPVEPILFITTPGADPSQELREVAKQEVGLERYCEGQGEIAINELKRLSASGGWLCLQNIHLAITWLSDLEKELRSCQPHENFRLWLTSEAHPKFPAFLLEQSFKITLEAPPGVKKNLQRIYESWSPDFIASGSALRAQALFALAWFHAVIQERRTYIPQGWNKFYEFSAADLRSSADVISKMCDRLPNNKAPQWDILHGLIENAIYGGRIDDAHDSNKLKVYLSMFFTDEVFAIGGKPPTRKLARGISIPTVTDHASFISTISDLPENDNLTMFGLPENIDRALQQSVSHGILEQLKTLTHQDPSNMAFDREKWSQELMPFLHLWKKLNTGIDLLQKKVSQSTDFDPIHSYIALELSNGVNLVRKIHSDLSNISKVLRGTLLLTNDMLSVATSLMKSETPKDWQTFWEGPVTPQAFIRATIQNSLNLDDWRSKSQSGTLFSGALKLSNVFNPVTFLNALRQQTSRKAQIALDDLVLTSAWSKSDVGKMPMFAAVEGLYIQGYYPLPSTYTKFLTMF